MTSPMDPLAYRASGNVPITVQRAGLPSRFAALLVDFNAALLLAGVIGFFVSMFFGMLVMQLETDSSDDNFAILLGLSVIAGLGVMVLYFVVPPLFGMATPAKHLLGLRVVDHTGAPASVLQHLGRLLILPTDILIGPYVMLLHPRGVRLGDLIVGTEVIHSLPMAHVHLLGDTSSFTVAEIQLLERWYREQANLSLDVRETFAETIVAHFDAAHPQFIPEGGLAEQRLQQVFA